MRGGLNIAGLRTLSSMEYEKHLYVSIWGRLDVCYLFDGYVMVSMEDYEVDEGDEVVFFTSLDITKKELHQFFVELQILNKSFKPIINYKGTGGKSYNDTLDPLDFFILLGFASLGLNSYLAMYALDYIRTDAVKLGNDTIYTTKTMLKKLVNILDGDLYSSLASEDKTSTSLLTLQDSLITLVDEEGVRNIGIPYEYCCHFNVAPSDIVSADLIEHTVKLYFKDKSVDVLYVEEVPWLCLYYAKFLENPSDLYSVIEDIKYSNTMSILVGDYVRDYGFKNIVEHTSDTILTMKDIDRNGNTHISTMYGDIFVISDHSEIHFDDYDCLGNKYYYDIEADKVLESEEIPHKDLGGRVRADNTLYLDAYNIHSIVVTEENLEVNLLCAASVNNGEQVIAKVPLGYYRPDLYYIADFLYAQIYDKHIYIHKDIVKYHKYSSRFKDYISCFGGKEYLNTFYKSLVTPYSDIRTFKLFRDIVDEFGEY